MIKSFKRKILDSCLGNMYFRVSVQGVESLWGDCRFIPADWGHSSRFVLFCSF